MRCHRRRRATPQAPRNPLPPEGLPAAWGRLLRCRASTMAPHRQRRGAYHPAPRRLQRRRADFYHGLLAAVLTLAATGTSAGGVEIRAPDLGGLEARSAALLLSGQEAGGLASSALAIPLPAEGGRARVQLVVDILGASLLEGAERPSLITEIYAYAVSAAGGVEGVLTRAFRLDLTEHGEFLSAGGIKFLGELDLPPGEYSLRLLILHRRADRFALLVMPLSIPAGGQGTSSWPAIPIVVEPADAWLVVHGEKDEPLFPRTVESRRVVPATRPVLGPDSSRSVYLAGGDDSGPLEAQLVSGPSREAMRLALGEPRPVSERLGDLRLWAVDLQLGGVAPGSYRLHLVSEAPEKITELPVVVSAQQLSDQERVWPRQIGHRAVAEIPDGSAVLPSGPSEDQHFRLVAAAYLEALQQWLAGGDDTGAVRELEIGRRGAAWAADPVAMAETQRRVVGQLAGLDAECLVPLMALQERLFRSYQAQERYGLATSARRLAVQIAEDYAQKSSTPEAGKNSALVLVSLAGYRQSLGARLDALATYERALDFDPDQTAALIALAALHESFGHYETTVDLLRRLARLTPLSPPARLRLAINLRRVGSTRQALKELRALAGSQPDWVSIVAYQQWSIILVEIKRAGEAAAVLAEALERHPRHYHLNIQQAALLDQLNRPIQARRALGGVELADGDDGDSPRLRYSELPTRGIFEARRSLAEAAVRRLPAALECAERLLTADPE